MDQLVNQPIHRKHRPLYIKVMVFDIAEDKQIRDLRVDISNGDKRAWLFDLILWATLNGKSVEMLNEKDDV